MSPPRIYAAHPMSTYGTARETRGLDSIRRAFPDAVVLNPAAEFDSHASWVEHWPSMLAALDGLVAFSDEGGWVGRGVFLEVTDALCRGLPVWCMRWSGPLSERFLLGPAPSQQRDYRRFARLVPLSPNSDPSQDRSG